MAIAAIDVGFHIEIIAVPSGSSSHDSPGFNGWRWPATWPASCRKWFMVQINMMLISMEKWLNMLIFLREFEGCNVRKPRCNHYQDWSIVYIYIALHPYKCWWLGNKAARVSHIPKWPALVLVHACWCWILMLMSDVGCWMLLLLDVGWWRCCRDVFRMMRAQRKFDKLTNWGQWWAPCLRITGSFCRWNGMIIWSYRYGYDPVMILTCNDPTMQVECRNCMWCIIIIG